MSASIALRVGYKFAVLSLPDLRAEKDFGSFFPAGDRLAATSGLPDGALDTWQESIGRFHRDELDETSLFLWATGLSVAPEVLDQENEDLKRSVYRFYLGLLVAVPYLSSGRLTSLTGANADGVARVRSLTTYPRTYFTLGAPTPRITMSRIKLAATLAHAIKVHDEKCGQSRFTRCLRTFREAMESPYLDQRLHQFVRCAEGFAVPPFKQSGKQFAKRLKRVCAGSAQRQIEQMYTIRGGIEHLHGPYDRLPPMSTRKQWTRVLVRTVEAEALARYLILTYLTHTDLWSHFRRRADIDDFWNFKPRDFKRLWPTRIAFASIQSSFDYHALSGNERSG
jgi:hypothetical protein